MDRQTAAQLISNNLKNIFAFSLSRLYDRDSAEDLANDIVCEVLKSVHRLEDDSAFYSFMWRIAHHTFKKRIRKTTKTVPFDEKHMEILGNSVEEEVSGKQNLLILRRELSLLTRQYRDVTVAYYVEGKSCSEISLALGISLEMVKYYLFKTRKILKEGFGMARELDEKSYNPGTFRMDYWGGGNNSCYWELFQRKLPGSILLAAYYAPMTMQELSLELGVAVPYLEDEIDLLLKHEVLAKTGDKYQTNIIIFTDLCEKDVAAKIGPIYRKGAQSTKNGMEQALPRLKALSFKGNHYGENRLKWTFTYLAMVFALNMAEERLRGRFGKYPPLTNGSHGFVFGYDNDYQNHHFNGIYGHCANEEKTAYFSVENYRAIEKNQRWEPGNWEKAVQAMTDAILEKEMDAGNDRLVSYIADGFIKNENGKLSAEFPVFEQAMLNGTIFDILQAVSTGIANCMAEVCAAAALIVKEHAPKALQAKCEQLAAIHYQMDVMAWIVETMIEQGYLTVPATNEKLCVFGVKR